MTEKLAQNLTPAAIAVVENYLRQQIVGDAADAATGEENARLAAEYKELRKEQAGLRSALEAEWRANGTRPIDHSATTEGWAWRVAREIGVLVEDEDSFDDKLTIGMSELDAVIAQLHAAASPDEADEDIRQELISWRERSAKMVAERRELVAKGYRLLGGNLQEVASLLGISRGTAYKDLNHASLNKACLTLTELLKEGGWESADYEVESHGGPRATKVLLRLTVEGQDVARLNAASALLNFLHDRGLHHTPAAGGEGPIDHVEYVAAGRSLFVWM